MKKKSIGIWAVVLAFILVSVPFGMWKVMAGTEPAYKIKILEVIDNGPYALKNALQDTPNVTVDTMRMKTFVAMRDELNGKYDAVYFGKGTYSTALPQTFTSGPSDPQRQAHDTTAIMNDITTLKAGIIENDYIQKGLPVIFHASIKNQDPQGKLYALYGKYKNASTRPSNVIVVDDSSLAAVVGDIKNGAALYKQRPQIEVVAKPLDFLAGSTKVYTTGDTLTFSFNANNVKNFKTPVNAKLYVSVDKVLKLTDENVVASSTLTERAETLTYKLPQTFSGPVYWRLEVSANGLRDYAEGAVRVHDKQTVIRVLQVMPKDSVSSLLEPGNMNQTYLKTGDYDIQITPVLFSEFNTAGGANSYSNLNGKYDMVIFGFIDNYNTQTAGSLTPEAADGVNAFIKTGQAVMFTHDTMIGNIYNPWIKNFQKTTGQTELYTNMGLGAPNKSTRTKIVNSGMLTQFPYDLSLKPGNPKGYVGQIARTHNQYYMLNLEDPNIVPWYNIVSEDIDPSKRDTDDSYDHYYTYSKGNVTYSGTGHTNTGFPEWEQKLFVNTMFRAFIGSNHAPTIDVIAPLDSETTKPSYLKDLVFSYRVNDLDLQDPTVYSSVRFKVNGEYVNDMAIAEKNVPKGSVITEKFTNPLQLKEGTVQIEITAHDKQGATVQKTIDLKIKKVAASLLADRALDVIPPNYEFLTGSPVGITYTVTPQPISASEIRSGESGLKQLEISNIVYKEKLQAGLEISGDLPEGMSKTGTVEEGYSLSKKFDKILYTLDGATYKPDAGSGISFHLDLVPTLKGSYTLNQARLTYEDVHATSSHSAAVRQLQNYSLIVLGTSDTTLSEGMIQKGVAINGSVTTSATIGQSLDAASPSPAFVTNGNLTISKGNIYKNAIMAKGDLTAPGLDFGEFSSAIAGGSVKFGYANGDATKLSYGGAYGGPDYVNPKPIRGDADALKNRITQAFDFADAKSNLTALSDSYAAMPVNGNRQPASGVTDGGVLTLTGTDAGLNVFRIDSADTTNMNDLKIVVPQGASAVVNISGGSLRLSNIVSADPTRTLINYTGTGTLYVGNAPTNLFPKGVNGSKVDSSVLAPYATVNYNNGNGSVNGSIVANELISSGSVTLNSAPFAGTEPPAVPVSGEPRDIPFPEILFTGVIKIKSIAMEDQAVWIDDSTAMVPVVTLSNGALADQPLLNWSSSDPAVTIEYPTGTKDGKAASVSVKGVKVGEAVITATATDGSGVSGSAKVRVEAPALSITGTQSVNVGQTIADIKAVVNASNLKIDKVDWTFTSTGSGEVTLVPQADPSSLKVTGVKSGRVTLHATADIVNTKTKTTKKLSATYEIDVTDSLDSVIINGPDTVKKGGTVDLAADIKPAAANIGSIVWSIADGEGKAILTPTGRAPQLTAVLEGKTPGPVTVIVTVKTAGDYPIEKTATKTVWVLDFAVEGPNTVYAGEPIDLTAGLLPSAYTGTRGPIAWSVVDDTDPAGTNSTYAKLGTPNSDGTAVSLTGVKPGPVKVIAKIDTPAGTFTAEHKVIVSPVVTGLLLPATTPVMQGAAVDLIHNGTRSLVVEPSSIKIPDIQNQLKWTSADPTAVSVSDQGVVTGSKAGREVVVTVSYQRTDSSPIITASTRVIVDKAPDPNAPVSGDRY
ncbi:DUF5057 domain-containing protein [Saccharibacillus alkalitolerans]|uniref:DUF5057 domain-containing protein n=1 Tax=Saccharibacillus alkalitolerans TaxID=2705290 RepID=A0ABX0F575_9BACL|nr:DUF5057 domain-containing protein [Saccharibacillus alkalitolerans]NGZ76086.1 DUF5057 domain-containing protein [Saccharibacillus alkalitolerans]